MADRTKRLRVCRVDEVVAGEIRTFEVPGEEWPVLVTILEHELIATPGVCPHRDVELADYGELCGAVLTCRAHGYEFDLRTGRCTDDPRLRMQRYPVTVIDDEVWVDIELRY
jgi:nitrite reductase/ring-hydroxylating ferredoxin subunit